MNKKHKLVAKKHRKNRERLKEIRQTSLAKSTSTIESKPAAKKPAAKKPAAKKPIAKKPIAKKSSKTK